MIPAILSALIALLFGLALGLAVVTIRDTLAGLVELVRSHGDSK